MSTVVMVSGGVDSFLAAARFPDAQRVYVNYGQRYDPLERRAVRDLYPGAAEVDISGMPALGEDYYVPARNLMLATIGVRYGSEICFAGMSDEQCPDKNAAAFEEMSTILSKHSKHPVTVFSPFWKLTKAEVVRAYLQSGGDPAGLLRTVSCYEGTDGACNDCEACFRRFVCLKVNGLDVPRPSSKVIREYGLRLLHSFSSRRQLTTLVAINSEETPVVRADLAAYGNLSKLSGVHPGLGYLVLHSSLPEAKRAGLVNMLRAEGVRYDALLMETPEGFFRRSWHS